MKAIIDYRDSNYFTVMTWSHNRGKCVEVVDFSNDKKELESRLDLFEDCEIIENKGYKIKHNIIIDLSNERN